MFHLEKVRALTCARMHTFSHFGTYRFFSPTLTDCNCHVDSINVQVLCVHVWGSVDVHECIQDAFLCEGQNSTSVPWELSILFLETGSLTRTAGFTS